MEEASRSDDPAALRQHHALCALFFEGRGYSPEFVRNMTSLIAEPGRMLRLTAGCDALCQVCPHRRGEVCRDEAKVFGYDKQVCELVGEAFSAGKTLPLKQFCQAVYDRILQQNLLAEVCGSCEWAKLCQEKWADGDFNRLLLASQPAD